MFIHRYSINSSFTVNSSLYVWQCGFENCLPGHHFGPEIRDHFLLHFVQKGRGTVRIDNKKLPVHAGQGFLIPPGRPAEYMADDQEPWEYYWLGFNGEDSLRVLSYRGLSAERPVFDFDSRSDIAAVFQNIIESYGANGNDFISISRLFAIFSYINPEYEMRIPKESIVNQAISFIEDKMGLVTIEELAQHFFFTRSHVFRLFKAAMGVSPQEYLLQFKVNRAASLLRTTNLSIKQICVESGFGNTSNFSRQFKAIYSFSPTEYRHRCRTRTAFWNFPNSPD